MKSTDRAFRALGQAEPDVFRSLLCAIDPDQTLTNTRLVREDVVDSHIHALPPPLDADWMALVGHHRLEHIECQGYKDTRFRSRLLEYHLTGALRYPKRRVRTTALWLMRPKGFRNLQVITRGDIVLRIQSWILPEIDAKILLANPTTACFAVGANPGQWTTQELCERVVDGLNNCGATWHQRHLATMIAAARGREKEMVNAMKNVNIEPVISKELEQIFEDRGRKEGRKEGRTEGRTEGRKEGREEGLRGALTDLMEARGLALTAEYTTRLENQRSYEVLRTWFRRALTATHSGAIFAD